MANEQQPHIIATGCQAAVLAQPRVLPLPIDCWKGLQLTPVTFSSKTRTMSRVVLTQQLLLLSTRLADDVDNDEYGSQDVTAGRVFAHDVLVPQLNGQEGTEQLTELLDQQVELSLVRNTTDRKTNQ